MTASPDIHAEVPAATVTVESGVIIRALEDTVARQAVQIAKQEALLRSYDEALQESRALHAQARELAGLEQPGPLPEPPGE